MWLRIVRAIAAGANLRRAHSCLDSQEILRYASRMAARPLTVLCFGEILWDSLPQGLFPGGAPVNVAYHLRQLGLRAVPVTAVGRDFLGDELLRRLRRWEMPAEGVSRNASPTGAVLVELDRAGVPVFRILDDVAWDQIELKDNVRTLAREASAVIFGTLAQRSAHNLRRLGELLDLAEGARRIYDVNLRPPFDSRATVQSLTSRAEVIKLNHDELLRLTDGRFPEDRLEDAARAFVSERGCRTLCVTAGARGAGLLQENGWHWERTRPVKVRDTVGAGDSFLASLTRDLLAGDVPPPRMLERACRLAEFVASREGAMPAYELDAEGWPTGMGLE
jgi:fructokinase